MTDNYGLGEWTKADIEQAYQMNGPGWPLGKGCARSSTRASACCCSVTLI